MLFAHVFPNLLDKAKIFIWKFHCQFPVTGEIMFSLSVAPILIVVLTI